MSAMSRILFLSLFLAVLFPLAVFAADAPRPHLTFLEGFDDVPLMPGFHELADSLLIFDKPDGKIIQSEACGAASWAAVRGFYTGALPQLGWRLEPASKGGQPQSLVFRREGDRLEIGVGKANLQHCSVKLRFSLTPE